MCRLTAAPSGNSRFKPHAGFRRRRLARERKSLVITNVTRRVRRTMSRRRNAAASAVNRCSGGGLEVLV